jgi:hypothetical protein
MKILTNRILQFIEQFSISMLYIVTSGNDVLYCLISKNKEFCLVVLII